MALCKLYQYTQKNMTIAVDISPISQKSDSAHKVRGVGYYIQHLQSALMQQRTDNKFIFFDNPSKIPANIDLLHIPYFDPFFVHLPKRKRVPTIVTVHDLIPLRFPQHFPSGLKGSLRLTMQKFLLKQAEAIITDSEASKYDVISLMNSSDKKVFTVYLAADEAFRQLQITEEEKNKLLQQYDLPQNFMLYVGDVTWNKNLPRIVSACQKVNVPLVLVGKALTIANYDKKNVWNKDLEMVHDLMDNDKNMHTLGFVPTQDLVMLYNLAIALLFPSLYEGFGLPVLEAMQSGCPVITSKNGSLPEVAGGAAYYVSANDIDSIAAGIKGIEANQALRKQLIEKGLEQAKKFSWNKTASQTVHIYEQHAKAR